MASSVFDRFAANLTRESVETLRAGLVGHDAVVDGPAGPHKMVYADYVASGRALHQIEEVVLREILPDYANSHTEASYVGGVMTRLRREARDIIRQCCNAGADHAVIFTGSGATQGLNRLVHLFDLPGLVQSGADPLVILGPYEHHSNILPWRESGAEVVELPESDQGGPCLETLDQTLSRAAGRPIVAAMSAASNVTGICADVTDITRRLKRAGARVVWDYAGGAPYLPIDMAPAPDAPIDAVVISPHKFVGGPQASGVLILRRDAVRIGRPTLPGGGTVRFVSPDCHDYSGALEAREEAGTPNVVGDLRAAMCFMVKQRIGQDWITQRNAELTQRAIGAWSDHPNIRILGRLDHLRLPIFSFQVCDGGGGFIHQQLFTRMLSDFYGIQARGGCACAGPYVHRLLGIDADESRRLRVAILAGHELDKPGFIRLNFSYLASDDDVDFILNSVQDLAQNAAQRAQFYDADPASAIFRPRQHSRQSDVFVT